MSDIREISGEDLTALQDVLSNLSEVGLDSHPALLVHNNRIRKGVLTYGYFEDGRLVGTISLFIEQKFIHQGGWVGHIEDVAVRADCGGRGIGQALVSHTVEKCRYRGCYKVILDCAENLVGFYGKAGFHEAGVCMRLDLEHE